MNNEIEETVNDKITDQEKIADLIVKNQVLEHKVMILASKVLDYYASSRLYLPTFTLVDLSLEDQPLNSKAKYKIVEVLDTSGPDKEIMVGKEMYDLRIDTETAGIASKQILSKLEELGIQVEYKEPEEKEQGEQLSLDLEDNQ